jgi:Protein of unknown function (DUF3592)
MAERFANVAERLAKIAFRSNTWKEVTATVEASAYHPAHLYNLASGDEGDKRFFEITFSYIVNGERFVDKYKRTEPLEVGHQIVILYDPSKPSQNNLSGSESKLGLRVVFWIIGATAGALLAYLSKHYGWSDFPH